jgi:hypothetical protein
MDLGGLCRELVRQSQVERLYCLILRDESLDVVAVDCDGYPLGYGEQRLRDSEFAELALSGTPVGRGVQITRRISRASKRTVVVGSLALRQDWLVTLVLENRFAGTELATLDDHTIEQWVILAALSSRLTAGVADVMPRASGVGEQAPTAGDASEPNGASSEDGERSETMSALAGENWNISRAARVLGMTRHGLKKRMRRLNLARS